MDISNCRYFQTWSSQLNAVIAWYSLLTLRVKADSALLELMERGVVGAVDPYKLLFEPLELRLVLGARAFYQLLQLLIKFVEVVFPALNVFLSLEQENLLFFVVMLHCLGQCILSILQHFY